MTCRLMAIVMALEGPKAQCKPAEKGVSRQKRGGKAHINCAQVRGEVSEMNTVSSG